MMIHHFPDCLQIKILRQLDNFKSYLPNGLIDTTPLQLMNAAIRIKVIKPVKKFKEGDLICSRRALIKLGWPIFFTASDEDVKYYSIGKWIYYKAIN